MSGPDRVVGTAPTAADLASLAQLYAADLAQFRAVSELDIDAWPTVRILVGPDVPADLAERFAAGSRRPAPAATRSSRRRYAAHDQRPHEASGDDVTRQS